MKKTIRDFDLLGKSVIIRCDFNVPISDGKITDDNRIVESLKTINYAIDKGAKLLLMSHLGRVKTEEDKLKNSLQVVAVRLSELIHREVKFIPETRGSLLEEAVNNLNNGEVILVENTRFEDVPDKLESNNDFELATYWSKLGDIYINDAFGTSHRAHASNVGIAEKLPSGVGFLVEKEIKMIGEVIENPVRPLTVILGGSKVSDKIGVIKNLVNIADYILIGGGMAFTFLKAKGLEVGSSIVDLENLDFCKEILEKYNEKIILPIDVVCGLEVSENSTAIAKKIADMNKNDMGLDIGQDSIELFINYLEKSKTVIWNGPVGVFEIEQFSNGTKAIANHLANQNIITIIGGGDTAAAVINEGYKESFTHVSTGGGASLEMLEGTILPGIEAIDNS
ncbi:MAG: phosphoglycerate kinase [Bacilli bacterium]|nr:phosphoglycerate kinase [Bacilli bacterium]MDD4547165.1 phosphoglycerate kinase [Bacilli bacterium]